VLLDTHVWLWHTEGDARRIAAGARRQIERARSEGRLIVSVASMFEIASLCAAGSLHLALPPESWIRQSLEIGRLQVAELTSAIAIEGGSIPTASLADPMDRLLVATALAWNVPLATRDTAIRAYAARRRALRVIDVSL